MARKNLREVYEMIRVQEAKLKEHLEEYNKLKSQQMLPSWQTAQRRIHKAKIKQCEQFLEELKNSINTVHCNDAIIEIVYKDKDKYYVIKYHGPGTRADVQAIIERDEKKYNVQLHSIQPVITGLLVELEHKPE